MKTLLKSKTLRNKKDDKNDSLIYNDNIKEKCEKNIFNEIYKYRFNEKWKIFIENIRGYEIIFYIIY